MAKSMIDQNGKNWETMCIECTTGIASGLPVWSVYLSSEGIGSATSFHNLDSAQRFADLLMIRHNVQHLVRIDSMAPTSLPESGMLRRLGMSLAEWK